MSDSDNSEKKAKNYVLTLWLHMTEICWEERLVMMVEDGDIEFVAYGDEVCPETGSLHYQAFCCFPNQRHPNAVRKMFAGCFCMPMYGSLRQNEVYCSKEGHYKKLGVKPSQGARNDLLKVKHLIETGSRTITIAEDDYHFQTVAKHSRFFHEYEHHIRSKKLRVDREAPKVYIRVGDSGSGKTRWLDEQFGLDQWARMPNPTSSWWITPTVSYSDTVLIDDVGPKKIPKVEEFLEWTDRYPIEFNAKGGHLWWKPKNIVFTSNVSWTSWWPDLTEAHKEAIERRLYRIDLVYKDRPVEHFYPNANQEEIQGNQSISSV